MADQFRFVGVDPGGECQTVQERAYAIYVIGGVSVA